MNSKEAAEYVASDPNIGIEEAEFTVGFCKADDKASFSSSIRGTSARALRHSEIEIEQIQVYNDENDSYNITTVEDFDGEGKIVAVEGNLPIGLIKLNNQPRSGGGYAAIVSTQAQVNFDDE